MHLRRGLQYKAHQPHAARRRQDGTYEARRCRGAWLVANYKSPSGVVVRASFGTLLGTGDLVSDVHAIATLLMLGRYLRSMPVGIGDRCERCAHTGARKILLACDRPGPFLYAPTLAYRRVAASILSFPERRRRPRSQKRRPFTIEQERRSQGRSSLKSDSESACSLCANFGLQARRCLI